MRRLAVLLLLMTPVVTLVVSSALSVSWGDVAIYQIPILALLLAAIVTLRWRKAVRRAESWQTQHCRQCGYDLQGSPSGTCSECGCFNPAVNRLKK